MIHKYIKVVKFELYTMIQDIAVLSHDMSFLESKIYVGDWKIIINI